MPGLFMPGIEKEGVETGLEAEPLIQAPVESSSAYSPAFLMRYSVECSTTQDLSIWRTDRARSS